MNRHGVSSRRTLSGSTAAAQAIWIPNTSSIQGITAWSATSRVPSDCIARWVLGLITRDAIEGAPSSHVTSSKVSDSHLLGTPKPSSYHAGQGGLACACGVCQLATLRFERLELSKFIRTQLACKHPLIEIVDRCTHRCSLC
jgi:hypothetical protein